MYLLDTNIISQTLKPKPNMAVLDWLRPQVETGLFLSVITIEEARYGIELLKPGRKRDALEDWMMTQVVERFRGRILPVTEEVADRCGRFVARKRKDGKNPDLNDMLIAATASVHQLKVVTLNGDDFKRLGVEIIEFLRFEDVPTA